LRPLAGVRWLVPSVIISLSTAWSPATASDIRSNAVPLSLVEPIKPLPLRANEDRLRASLGRQLFKDVRLSANNRVSCSSCHTLMGDYFARRGNPTEADLGRYAVTKEAGDQHVFKVPSLRNVALTAPYFQDGSTQTLDAAVDVMFMYQLSRVATKEDKLAIIGFLNTLTGDVPDAP
jgi:cytochrome c peroxidase